MQDFCMCKESSHKKVVACNIKQVIICIEAVSAGSTAHVSWKWRPRMSLLPCTYAWQTSALLFRNMTCLWMQKKAPMCYVCFNMTDCKLHNTKNLHSRKKNQAGKQGSVKLLCLRYEEPRWLCQLASISLKTGQPRPLKTHTTSCTMCHVPIWGSKNRSVWFSLQIMLKAFSCSAY